MAGIHTILSDRQQRLLQFVVNTYIKRGVPVGSRAVAHEAGFNVSPATIRNDMGVLADHLFVARPHTSAGVVPLERGYRFVIQTIPKPYRISENDAKFLLKRLFFDDVRVLERWAHLTALVLSELLGTVAFVIPPLSRRAVLTGLSLFPLNEQLIQLIAVLDRTQVYKKLLNVSDLLNDEQLHQLEQTASVRLLNRHREQLSIMLSTDEITDLERVVANGVLELMREHYTRVVKERVVGGVDRFVNRGGQEQGEDIREIALALNTDDIFMEIAEQTNSPSGPQVTLGTWPGPTRAREFSAIANRYQLGEETFGTLGIIDTPRTDYERSMAVVNYTTELVCEQLEALY